MRAANRLETRKKEIETLLSLDTGNAIRTQAIPETSSAIELFYMFAGLAGELKGENFPPNMEHVLHYTTRDPIGSRWCNYSLECPIVFNGRKNCPCNSCR